MINSVMLESKYAKYPCVAVDKSIVEKILSDMKSDLEDDYMPGYKMPHKLKEFAQELFLDYLSRTDNCNRTHDEQPVFMLDWFTSFYQLIGFGALIAMGLSYWQNDKRTILLWQVVANLIFAIHYTLLHARSGALCSFFQIVVLLLFLLQEKFNWSKLVTAIPIVAVFLLIAVVTYETPVTVLPIVASLAALLPFFQTRRRVIQMAGIASGLSWLVYVIVVRSYSGMVTESVLTIITAASLLKKETRKP